MARCCQSLGECARDYFHLIVLISAFFNAYACLCRILDVCTVICGGVTLPEDAARREANRADNERRQA
jgi:hypothetical protein